MPIVKSIVRHLLTAGAGCLITVGISEGDANNLVSALEPIVSGVILYSVGQAWSLFDKRSE